MDVLTKFNVNIIGNGDTTLVMAHGFGSDQHAWRYQIPMLSNQYRLVLFDHLGCGKADVSDYNPSDYNSFQQYADIILTI
jgi:sigma-B regulation protein RsbQ